MAHNSYLNRMKLEMQTLDKEPPANISAGPIDDSDLYKSLCNFIKKKPIWGICAGMVLLSKYIINNNIRENGLFSNLDCVPIEIERNYYGSQINSFTKYIDFPDIGIYNFKCIFIRAPLINYDQKYFIKYLAIVENSTWIFVSFSLYSSRNLASANL